MLTPPAQVNSADELGCGSYSARCRWASLVQSAAARRRALRAQGEGRPLILDSLRRLDLPDLHPHRPPRISPSSFTARYCAAPPNRLKATLHLRSLSTAPHATDTVALAVRPYMRAVIVCSPGSSVASTRPPVPRPPTEDPHSMSSKPALRSSRWYPCAASSTGSSGREL